MPEIWKRFRILIPIALLASIVVFLFVSATASNNPEVPDQVHKFPRHFKEYGVRYLSAQEDAALNLATDVFVVSLGLFIGDQIYRRREAKDKRGRLLAKKPSK